MTDEPLNYETLWGVPDAGVDCEDATKANWCPWARRDCSFWDQLGCRLDSCMHGEPR